jgi:hypothetical protein
VHYQAPEAADLFTVMDPVETNARDFGDAVQQVATVLTAYAEEIRPIKAALVAVKTDALAFRSKIAGNAEWEYDQDLVDENTALVTRVNAAQVKLWDAERTCANGIRALYCAAPWHAATSADDPLGYGVSDIPADAPMAWGASVERQDHCPKSAAVGVKRFVWDGLVVDGLWGTVVGLGALVGVKDWAWSAENFTESWTAMGGLIGYADGQWAWGTAGDSWLALGKGLIAYDMWAEDPARAAGGAGFNILTIVVPAGAAVSGTKAAASAAGTTSRAAALLAKGAKIVDFLDPAALLFKGGKLALPQLGDLLAGMRGATDGLGDALRLPDVPAGLDLPTRGVDDLADALPPVRDPDVQVPVREPVQVEVPANQLVGPDGTPIRETPGGTGAGADDLTGPQAPPTGPIHAPGTDAPTGGSSHPDPSHGGPSHGSGHGGAGTGGGTGGPSGGDVPARRVWSPDDEPVETVPATEAPRPFTDADVQRAWDEAPVDAEGRPVDHRTGEPVSETRADDARGWHMTWDPEHQTWVAERPGTGFPAPGTMPDHGVPGSFGYDEHGALMEYANYRPEYDPGQVEAVWDAAPKHIDESGKSYVEVFDVDGLPQRVYWEPGQPRKDLWDMGHVQGEEYRDLRRRYLEHEIPQEQFLAEYRDPDRYGVAHPGRNRSHIDEA